VQHSLQNTTALTKHSAMQLLCHTGGVLTFLSHRGVKCSTRRKFKKSLQR
jgi:hypothetical protein